MSTVVLVVDDDPVIRKLLTVNFELKGYVAKPFDPPDLVSSVEAALNP